MPLPNVPCILVSVDYFGPLRTTPGAAPTSFSPTISANAPACTPLLLSSPQSARPTSSSTSTVHPSLGTPCYPSFPKRTSVPLQTPPRPLRAPRHQQNCHKLLPSLRQRRCRACQSHDGLHARHGWQRRTKGLGYKTPRPTSFHRYSSPPANNAHTTPSRNSTTIYVLRLNVGNAPIMYAVRRSPPSSAWICNSGAPIRQGAMKGSDTIVLNIKVSFNWICPFKISRRRPGTGLRNPRWPAPSPQTPIL